MTFVWPGTYRITNVASSTVLTVPDNNEWDVVCWHRHNGRNQQWYLQRSGDGYRFKNCRYGHYLIITDTKTNSLLRMGKYPTTWSVFINGNDYNVYIIKDGEIDRVADLDNGAKHDGNHLHTWDQGGWNPTKRWSFERLSDETGDEEWQLRQEVAQKNEQLASKDRQLTSKAEEIVSRDRRIAERDTLAAELTGRLAYKVKELANKDQELIRIKQELSEKSALLEQTQNALRQAEASNKPPNIEPEISGRSLEDELLQQRKETASLREQMDRFERMFSQMTDPGAKRPNNMT
ncbi:hypothetical protein BDV93DRAFT_602941 [Ceratobasidium sp. AG-I]|nr:hypothetical protein BDV93DRAFT_602941 [Ceratobasidium sp. AG-I]